MSSEEDIKRDKECVWISQHDLTQEDSKYNLSGYYRVTLRANCYEFMQNNQVTKIPLTKFMGVGSFKNVTPEKIHTG